LLKGKDIKRHEEANRVALCEDPSPGSAFGRGLLLADGGDDLGELETDDQVVLRESADPSEVGESLVFFVLGRQPSPVIQSARWLGLEI
jgi:hypothetical protein